MRLRLYLADTQRITTSDGERNLVAMPKGRQIVHGSPARYHQDGVWTDKRKERLQMKAKGEAPLEAMKDFKDISYVAKHKGDLNKFYREKYNGNTAAMMQDKNFQKHNEEVSRAMGDILERK